MPPLIPPKKKPLPATPSISPSSYISSFPRRTYPLIQTVQLSNRESCSASSSSTPSRYGRLGFQARGNWSRVCTPMACLYMSMLRKSRPHPADNPADQKSSNPAETEHGGQNTCLEWGPERRFGSFVAGRLRCLGSLDSSR